jgi:6-methylsalicylate decarboxylase
MVVEGTLEHMDRCGIAMQLLRNIPKSLDGLRNSNDFGASIVGRHPSRFRLLAAVRTDNPDAA